MSWFLLVFVFGVVPVGRGLFRGVGACRRLGDARLPQHACQGCQINHPPFANYCRRCGRRL